MLKAGAKPSKHGRKRRRFEVFGYAQGQQQEEVKVDESFSESEPNREDFVDVSSKVKLTSGKRSKSPIIKF